MRALKFGEVLQSKAMQRGHGYSREEIRLVREETWPYKRDAVRPLQIVERWIV